MNIRDELKAEILSAPEDSLPESPSPRETSESSETTNEEFSLTCGQCSAVQRGCAVNGGGR